MDDHVLGASSQGISPQPTPAAGTLPRRWDTAPAVRELLESRDRRNSLPAQSLSHDRSVSRGTSLGTQQQLAQLVRGSACPDLWGSRDLQGTGTGWESLPRVQGHRAALLQLPRVPALMRYNGEL